MGSFLIAKQLSFKDVERNGYQAKQKEG